MVLGVPIVRLLYEHGRFRAEDTLPTATALFLYSFGLVGYTGVKVLAPAFYALGRSRVPLVGSVLAVLTNLDDRLARLPRFGFRAIAIGTALGLAPERRAPRRQLRAAGRRPARPRARCGRSRAWLASAAVMGVAGGRRPTASSCLLGARGLLARLVTCLVPVAIGVLGYGVLTRLLRVGEAEAIGRLVLDRLRRRRRVLPS